MSGQTRSRLTPPNALNCLVVALILAFSPMSATSLCPPDSASQKYFRAKSTTMKRIVGKNVNLRKLYLRRASIIDVEEEEGPSRQELFRRRGMAAALFSTYFTVMGAKCALPSVLSQLTSPKIGLSFEGLITKPQTLMAQQLTLATFAVALGKLLLGPIIDHYGGALSLKVCLSILMMLLALISSSSHFITFAVSWIGVDFVFSSCWAGCINAIHESFPEKEWAKRVGMIAAGARIGNASAFFIFSVVLQWCSNNLPSDCQPWRYVFGVSAILQIIPISLLHFFGRIIIQERKENESERTALFPMSDSKFSSLTTLRKEAIKPEFWLHLMSRSLLMVFSSFLLFVPTFMFHVYGLGDSSAAQVGSIFAIGCLLSVTLLSSLYSTLRKKEKIFLSSTLMGIATACSAAQFAHTRGLISLTTNLSILSMFLWGFSFAVPFYLPSSMFALARGGKESSATISDVFDIFGFGLLAIFNGYVASIEHCNISAWIPTFQILTGCSVVSLISLGFATFLE